MSNRTYALITGASKGIGLALAEACARRGMNVIMIARSEELLVKHGEHLANRYRVDIRTKVLDLSAEGAGEALYVWCQSEGLAVRILINNAGFGAYGRFGQLPLDKQLGMINLNIKAVVSLCHLFLPMLKEQQEAFILNVASIAGYLTIPYYSVYSSTKNFVISFSETLRMELAETRVRVCCLCPADTQTEFFEQAGSAHIARKYMRPEDLAEIAIDRLLQNHAVIHPKVAVRLLIYLPKRLIRRIQKKRLEPQ